MVENLIQLEYVKMQRKITLKFVSDRQVNRFIAENNITDYSIKQVAYKKEVAS